MKKITLLMILLLGIIVSQAIGSTISLTFKVTGDGGGSYWLTDTSNNTFCDMQLQPGPWGTQVLTLNTYNSGDNLVLSPSPYDTAGAIQIPPSSNLTYNFNWETKILTPDSPKPTPLVVTPLQVSTTTNQAVSENLTTGVTGGTTPYAMTITSVPSHGNYYLKGTTVNYTPSNGFCGTDLIKYNVTDSSNPPQKLQNTLTITVTAESPLVVLPTYIWDVNYSPSTAYNLDLLKNNVITGGVQPYTTTITNSTLPSNEWSFNSTNYTITVNNPDVGTYTFNLEVKDSIGETGNGTITLNIQNPPSPLGQTIQLQLPANCFHAYWNNGPSGGGTLTLINPSTTYNVEDWYANFVLPKGWSISQMQNIVTTTNPDGTTNVSIISSNWGNFIPLNSGSAASYWLSFSGITDWSKLNQILSSAFTGYLLCPPEKASVSLPAHVFAPYFDTSSSSIDLANWMNTYNFKFATLAFVIADESNQPSWNGVSTQEPNSYFFARQIENIRKAGGDVIVSFGGANGQEIADVITNVPDLVKAYENIISNYNLQNIDFDIEGNSLENYTGIIRRAQALAIIQKDYPTINISYTLPVLPTGLNSDGLNAVRQAILAGVKLSTINLMTMDYGGYFDSQYTNNMVVMNEDAVNTTEQQLKQFYPNLNDSQLYGMIGMTPMLGINDDTAEIVSVANAQTLAQFAIQKGLGRVSFWSINRDNQSTSGVAQSTGEFSKTFNVF